VALCLLALLVAPCTAPAATGSPTLPPQGIYEGCAPAAELRACVARLTTIRSAGFQYVLNYSAWYGSPAEIQDYADAAVALDLQLIWPLNHPAWRGSGSLDATYTDLSEAEDLSNSELIGQAIDMVRGHPATWGFYVGDEVSPTEADRVAWLSATVRQLAPNRPQLYVARPDAALLKPFLPLIDIAGFDTYPVGSADPRVWRVASLARSLATASGTPTAIVLQAFSWSQYQPDLPAAYPSKRRLQIMRDAAIRYGSPALILWYSYQDILRSDAPRQRWSNLRHAAFSPRCGLLRPACVPSS
jgi:hypothetical protein